MKKILSFFAFVVLCCDAAGQINSPNLPQPGGFTPVLPQHQPSYGQATSAPVYTSSTPAINLGATAETIRSQQYNGNSRSSQQNELQTLLAEMRQQERRYPQNAPPSAITRKDPRFQKLYADRNAAYTEALRGLKEMLSGKRPLSVANAYFITESAYGEPYLTQAQLDNILDQSAAFIRAWMREHHLDTLSNDVKNLAIQRFMSETLTIAAPSGKTQTHKPYFYDYEDFTGEKDFRNTFATKCLATGSGQCAGMPVVYLMLAERLNARAYLTVIPQHLFVKYPCSDGTIRNYEPTSNWEITDQWYADNSFISPEAIKSGLFLDTFNRQQIVANCILDLANSYTMRVGMQMGMIEVDFMRDCIRHTLPYFPRNNNFMSICLHSSMLKAELMTLLERAGIKDVSQINQHAQAQMVWNAYQHNEAYLTSLGYQPIPDGMYQNMMNQHEFKGRLQRAAGRNGKQTRSLFNSAIK